MKNKNIIIGALFSILIISLANMVMAQEQILVGVSQGDVFYYKLDSSFSQLTKMKSMTQYFLTLSTKIAYE